MGEGEPEKSGVHEKGREIRVAHQKVPRYCPVRYGHAVVVQTFLINAARSKQARTISGKILLPQ